MFLEFKRGITREVFLIGKYAIKIPSFRSYKLFLTGILCNIQERMFSKGLKTDLICPVLLMSPLGFVIIMPRCEPSGFKSSEEVFGVIQKYRDAGIPVECKPCSFGFLNGRLVALDYGS